MLLWLIINSRVMVSLSVRKDLFVDLGEGEVLFDPAHERHDLGYILVKIISYI